MAYVLLLSPDEELLQTLSSRVADIGCAPLAARTLAEARLALAQVMPDVTCVDWEFGAAELAELRRWLGPVGRRDRGPVILMVSPSTALLPDRLPPFLEPDRDHVIAKPVEPDRFDEVLTAALAAGPSFGGRLTLEATSRELRAGPDLSVRLSPTEFRLLDYLMHRPGTVVPDTELLEVVLQGRGSSAPEQRLRQRVSKLRAKLRRHGLSDVWLRAVVGRRSGSGR